MATVSGLAADDAWQKLLLPSSAHAVVVSSFPHALNITYRGELIFVVTNAASHAPGALHADLQTLPLVPPATPVTVKRGIVSVVALDKYLKVDASHCKYYSCAVKPLSVRIAASAAVDLEACQAALRSVVRAGSFLPSAREGPVQHMLRDRLVQRTDTYQSALQHHIQTFQSDCLSDHAIRRAVAGLVGLGPGLTPTGDDYLVGSLAILQLLPTLEPVMPSMGKAVLQVVDRTTDVGAAYLKAATMGRFQQHLAHAARLALTSTPSQIRGSFSRVAMFGATSGTDALRGLVDTLSTVVETEIISPQLA